MMMPDEQTTFDVYSSATALRFYIVAGWSKEILNSCIIKGELIFYPSASYWTLSPGGKMDVVLLYKYCRDVFDHRDQCLQGSNRTNHLKRLSGN